MTRAERYACLGMNALDIYVHFALTANTSHHKKQHNPTAISSSQQHCFTLHVFLLCM